MALRACLDLGDSENTDDVNDHYDREWMKLQDKNIPFYNKWFNIVKDAPKPWPLIENKVNAAGPPSDFRYIKENIQGPDIPKTDNSFCIGCEDCGEACSVRSCDCATAYGTKFAYDQFGRVRQEFVEKAIVECNSRCKCGPKCPNRMVQNGRKNRLVIFQTKGKGWGVKTPVFIPAGTFIDEYVGEIISIDEANDRTKADIAHGSIYLFDLDCFEEEGTSLF